MSVIAPFPTAWDRRPIAKFDRRELTRILDLYGRMVAAGHWRDYALRIDPDVAVFAAYRRYSERPEIRIDIHVLDHDAGARPQRPAAGRRVAGINDCEMAQEFLT